MTDEQQFTPDWFSKPGDSLRALMQRRGIAPEAVARALDGGMPSLRGLLSGSLPINERHASELTASLGGSATFWLKRQATYETALDRATDKAAAVEGDQWLQIPVPGDRPRGRLSEQKRRDEIRRRLAFFNVGTIKAWEARYGKLRTATLFRNASGFQSDDASILMWLRSGELGADMVGTRTFNPGNLKDRLAEIRKLTRVRQPERFLPKLRELCAEAGVAVVVEKAPSGCHAFGASRMVASDKAMLLLSFRYRSDDQFWFTVFHEIGHLVLHDARTFVDDDHTELNESEREANEFASRCIIPEKRASEFEELSPDKDSVLRFSVSVEVAPGLTVGQMQHRKMISPKQLNFLKRRWDWSEIDAATD